MEKWKMRPIDYNFTSIIVDSEGSGRVGVELTKSQFDTSRLDFIQEVFQKKKNLLQLVVYLQQFSMQATVLTLKAMGSG